MVCHNSFQKNDQLMELNIEAKNNGCNHKHVKHKHCMVHIYFDILYQPISINDGAMGHIALLNRFCKFAFKK